MAVAAMLVAVGLVAGLVSGAFGAVARDGLYATGLWSRNGASTLPSDRSDRSDRPTPTPTPTSRQSTATPEPGTDLPGPVLAAAEAGRTPSAAKVTAKIRGVKVAGVGSSYTGAVLDVGSGKTLFAHNAEDAYIPASTMKLLTSAAALSILGPDRVFTTKVVSPKRGRVILVGGGDPYLATKTTASTFPKRSSVATLARNTATALKKDKVTKVSLGYDDSLFSGPRWNPTWPDFYSDQVTPISALWVDEGRVSGSPGARVKNPSKAAAEAYAAALRQQGIEVSGISVERASNQATPVASVGSMPLERIVEQLLMVSDNDAAEVVLRQAALGAGKKGTFTDGVSTVRARLTKLGVWDSSAKIYDGSGLSRKTHVPADTMVKLLRLASQDAHPELRSVITGLPVAGVEGSLRTHYSDDESLAGRGLVRGKTGTLNKVHSLAGFVRTRDGSLLVYAFLVNNAKNDFNAKVWLDRTSAALSTCGCR
ncbi:MAG TPA: D-alanyl-D-alanine carboxypeptidase/D-alanyl-D-alanine-endopeptidase [Propionibacteriaceae bacterium]